MKEFVKAALSIMVLVGIVQAAWVNVTGTLAGMATNCGNVSCLVAVPGQNKVIAGINAAGLYASTNNGASWQPLGSSTYWVDLAMIIFDSKYPDTMWECAVHGGGLHRSYDGGSTYVTLPKINNADGISVDMTDPLRRTIVCGSHEGSDLEKSTDGGNTWTNITAGTSGWTNFPVVIDSQTFIEGSTNSGIYRTTNGGANWTQVCTTSPSGHPLYASNGYIYFVVAGDKALLRSTDQGRTWTTIVKQANSAGNYNYAPLEMPDHSIVAIGNGSLVACSDGVHWTTIVNSFPSSPGNDKQGFAYNSVTHTFFVSFVNCSSTVPANAVWAYDNSTAVAVPAVGHVQAGRSASIAVGIGSRVSICARVNAESPRGIHDVCGRLVQKGSANAAR